MRIAIYHNLPSGGGKRALQQMTAGLAQRHRIDVFSLSSAEHDFCDLRPLVNRHVISEYTPVRLAHSPFGRINPVLRMIELTRLERLQKKIAAEIDQGGYDVVFVHHCRFSQAPAVMAYLRTPTVYYCAEPPRTLYEPPISRPYSQATTRQKVLNKIDPLGAIFRQFWKSVDRRYTLKADQILVNSAFSREVLYRVYGVDARVCYLGVDTRKFYPKPVRKENYVVSVGMLNSRKGFDFLIESLARVHQELRPRLQIATNSDEPQERRFLEGLAATRNVNMTIHPMVTDDELCHLYNQAQLALYSPVMEPFGFVPIESQACGTPVIGVREGGVRETVDDGRNGWLVDRDPREMAEKIENLLAHPDEIKTAGDYGAKTAPDQWSVEKSIEKLESYLMQVLPNG